MAKVVLENVRVDFPIYAMQRNLRTAIFQRATGGLIQRQGKNRNRVVVKALAGVSMTPHDGDRFGLIGHNGCGKSILLKVLAGIYEPIEGSLLVEGRVTPLQQGSSHGGRADRFHGAGRRNSRRVPVHSPWCLSADGHEPRSDRYQRWMIR